MLYTEAPTFTDLLDLLADVTIDYLKMQVNAGAEILMLFDSWAANLAAADYRTFVFPAVQKVMKELNRSGVPLIYYPVQGGQLYAELEGLSVDVIAVDWRNRLSRAIKTLRDAGLDVSVQGNLDPQALMGDEAFVRRKVREILQEGKAARGHIFNVGHGLMPHISPEAITWAINEIRSA